MTPQQLWKLAYRTCESKLRKSGAVFSEAEIMEEFPQMEKYLGHVEEIETKHEPKLEVGLYPIPITLSGGVPFKTDGEKLNTVEYEDFEDKLTAAFEAKIEASKE